MMRLKASAVLALTALAGVSNAQERSFSNLVSPQLAARIEAYIWSVDRDGDGLIRGTEWAALPAGFTEQADVPDLDRNGDGGLDGGEVATLARFGAMSLLFHCDANADGALDASEDACIARAMP
jgi:hypothetical protein